MKGRLIAKVFALSLSVAIGSLLSCGSLPAELKVSPGPSSDNISETIRQVGTSKPFGINPGVSLGQLASIFPDLEPNYNGFLESQIDESKFRPFTSIEVYFSKDQRITGFQLTTDYIPTSDDGRMLKERYNEMVAYISKAIGAVSPTLVDTVDQDVADPSSSWMSRLSQGVTVGKEKLNATWRNPETRSRLVLRARAVGQRNGFLNLEVKFSW